MITEVDLVTDTFILMKSLRSKLTLFWTMTTSTRTVTLTIPSSLWHRGRRMLTSNNKQITFIILRMKLAWNLNSCRSSFFSGILTKQDNNVGCGHPYCGHWVNLTNWDNKKKLSLHLSSSTVSKSMCVVYAFHIIECWKALIFLSRLVFGVCLWNINLECLYLTRASPPDMILTGPAWPRQL